MKSKECKLQAADICADLQSTQDTAEHLNAKGKATETCLGTWDETQVTWFMVWSLDLNTPESLSSWRVRYNNS